jgi:hypothetical protein
VDVADPVGDVVGGPGRVHNGRSARGDRPDDRTPGQCHERTAVCSFIETSQNDPVRIDLRLADRAGHASNVISDLATLEGSRPRS